MSAGLSHGHRSHRRDDRDGHEVFRSHVGQNFEKFTMAGKSLVSVDGLDVDVGVSIFGCWWSWWIKRVSRKCRWGFRQVLDGPEKPLWGLDDTSSWCSSKQCLPSWPDCASRFLPPSLAGLTAHGRPQPGRTPCFAVAASDQFLHFDKCLRWLKNIPLLGRAFGVRS